MSEFLVAESEIEESINPACAGCIFAGLCVDAVKLRLERGRRLRQKAQLLWRNSTSGPARVRDRTSMEMRSASIVSNQLLDISTVLIVANRETAKCTGWAGNDGSVIGIKPEYSCGNATSNLMRILDPVRDLVIEDPRNQTLIRLYSAEISPTE